MSLQSFLCVSSILTIIALALQIAAKSHLWMSRLAIAPAEFPEAVSDEASEGEEGEGSNQPVAA